jgi:hypothetical protein
LGSGEKHPLARLPLTRVSTTVIIPALFILLLACAFGKYRRCGAAIMKTTDYKHFSWWRQRRLWDLGE